MLLGGSVGRENDTRNERVYGLVAVSPWQNESLVVGLPRRTVVDRLVDHEVSAELFDDGLETFDCFEDAHQLVVRFVSR
jgi:hypothetical protein